MIQKDVNGIKFVKNKYCLSKTVRTKDKKQEIAFLQFSKQTISWDMYGMEIEMNKKGIMKIFELFLSLDDDCFKFNKRGWKFSISSRGYSFILFNKEFIKEGYKKILSDLYKILIQDENYNVIGKMTNQTSFDEIDVYKEFNIEWKELENKYVYWINKKKENKHYNRFQILQRDGFKCKLCGRSPPEVKLHIDHWIPKSKGGLDIEENLITACSECNLSKSATIPKNKIEEVRDR